MSFNSFVASNVGLFTTLLLFGILYAYYISFKKPANGRYTWLSVVVGCVPIGICITYFFVSLLLHLEAPMWAIYASCCVPTSAFAIPGLPMIVGQLAKWNLMSQRYEIDMHNIFPESDNKSEVY